MQPFGTSCLVCLRRSQVIARDDARIVAAARRAKGVSLAPKAALDEVEEALQQVPVKKVDHGPDSTTSQTDSGEADPNMLKTSRANARRRRRGFFADGERAMSSELDAEEVELYTTPAHLLGVIPVAFLHAEESSAQRWLAGIIEVEVGVEEKMATIEPTEGRDDAAFGDAPALRD